MWSKLLMKPFCFSEKKGAHIECFVEKKLYKDAPTKLKIEYEKAFESDNGEVGGRLTQSRGGRDGGHKSYSFSSHLFVVPVSPWIYILSWFMLFNFGFNVVIQGEEG